MKNGTAYGKKLKQAYRRFRGKGEPVALSHDGDPVDQLILAVLAQETTTARALRAMKRLSDDMVDLNDLRVSTAAEVSDSISRHVPRSVHRAKLLLKVLNGVYHREYAVSLQSLRSKGIREVKQYLESLEGTTPYVCGSVILWSLVGHAIPVSDPMLQWLRDNDLVHPDAEPGEVQSFLERHVSAADARTFCLDLEAQSVSREPLASAGKRTTASRKTSAKRKSSARKAVRRTDKTTKKTKRKT